MLTDVFRDRWCINVVKLFTSPPDLSVVFSFLFVFVVVCLVLLSLVAAAFLANKDVYIMPKTTEQHLILYFKYIYKKYFVLITLCLPCAALF